MQIETVVNVPLGYNVNHLSANHPCGSKIPPMGDLGLKWKRATIQAINGRDLSIVNIEGRLIYYAYMTGFSRAGELVSSCYGKIPAEEYIKLDGSQESNSGRMVLFIPDNISVKDLYLLQDVNGRPDTSKTLVLFPGDCALLTEYINQGVGTATIDKYNTILGLYKAADLTEHDVFVQLKVERNTLISKYRNRHGFCVKIGKTSWFHVVNDDGSVKFAKNEELHNAPERCIKTAPTIIDFHEFAIANSDYGNGRTPESERLRSLQRINYLSEAYSILKF